MHYSSFKNKSLSRLMLGTAQFGLDYGVANRSGKPDISRVRAILECALENGVNCFDTAAAYGDSEIVLGRLLCEMNALDDVFIVTKVRHLSDAERDTPQLAKQIIENSVDQSRKRLGIDCLPLVMFHKEADARYLDVLEDLRDRGWLQHIGSSCGTSPEKTEKLSEHPLVEALQVPYNMLDSRYLTPAMASHIDDREIAIFARSAYLQGLLVMPESDIPSALSEVLPVRRLLGQLAEQYGMALSEFALRYVLSNASTTCVVLGVDTAEQLRQNLKIIQRGSLPNDLLQTIDQIVPSLPDRLITPSQWSR